MPWSHNNTVSTNSAPFGLTKANGKVVYGTKREIKDLAVQLGVEVIFHRISKAQFRVDKNGKAFPISGA